MSSVLCLDIGGTRIKAATLPKAVSVEGLAKRPVFSMPTLGWLNASLPELLSVDNPDGVVGRNCFGSNIDEIAIGVPGLVKDGKFTRSDLPVATDLKREFSRFTDKNVTLVKDADAWMVGATAYSELVKQDMQYPAMALIFGTGVGLSMTRDGKHFDSLEISELPKGFSSLSTASEFAIDEAWQVHNVLGNRFFEWVASRKQDWCYPRIRDEFSRRVVALLEDLLVLLTPEVGRVKTISLGGGNSEYVSPRLIQDKMDYEVQFLARPTARIDPDLLPLVGLHKIVFDPDVVVDM